jgi:hypothetical protein
MQSGIKSINGSALMIAAIAVLAAGLGTAGILYSLQSITRETQEEKSIARMNKVVHAMASYLQKNRRLPCPADPSDPLNPGVSPSGGEPFGAERGSGASGTATASSTACNATPDQGDGIVPFKTIGLSRDDVQDGWGHWITYHVDQSSLAAMNEASAEAYLNANPNVNVDQLCRVKDVWLNTSNPSQQYWFAQTTLNCCMQPGTDTGTLYVVDANGNNASGLSSGSGQYGNAHTNVPGYPSNAIKAPYTLSAQGVTMVLISHGRNAIGAYTGQGTHSRLGRTYNSSTSSTFMDASTISTGEKANANGDLNNPPTSTTFYIEPKSEGWTFYISSNYYDDVVMYETLPMLYGNLGADSSAVSTTCSWTPGCAPISQAAELSGGYYNSKTFPVVDVYGNACP